MALSPPVNLPLSDRNSELTRVSQNEAIKELQRLPASSMRIVAKNLNMGTTGVGIFREATIFHGLGREPQFVWVSAPRFSSADILAGLTAGYIVDMGNNTHPAGSNEPIDRTKRIVIGAAGFTGSPIIDVAVA